MKYSNLTALKALIKASLQSISKSPSAIVFSIAFPLIFILVFGFLTNGGISRINVGIEPQSDTSHFLYKQLEQIAFVKLLRIEDTAKAQKLLKDGTLAARLSIKQNDASAPVIIQLNTSTLAVDKANQLRQLMTTLLQSRDPEIVARTQQLVQIQTQVSEGRAFKTIDFILPGQLGFSLLSGSVFGTAFVFFNMRQTLVLKRFFATPVRKEIIVLSEGIARMFFQLLSAVIIIAIGHYAFGYTLVNGFTTFLALIALSALAILIFMAAGFIISGIVKNDASIPMFANMVVLPQFLLAGTFFPVEAFPWWLQPVSRIMPLTYLNDAMRLVAFEGAGFWDVKWDIAILLLWGLVLYFIAGRVFKWE